MALSRKKNKIPIGLRVESSVHKKLQLVAQAQKRSIANQAEFLILQALDEYDLPQDKEMLNLASENWPDTNEDIYDVVRKNKRLPL